MARRPREDVADAIQHVYARGNNRQLLFLDDIDRELYLGLLAHVTQRQKWYVLAYCLMPNHVHLLIETPEPNLGDGMRELHGRFARTFHHRHGRDGHHFARRYGNRRVKTDAQFHAVVGYIVANPVKAGLCSQPAEWRWSSHADIARGRVPDWLAVERLISRLAVWSNPADVYDRLVEERMAA